MSGPKVTVYYLTAEQRAAIRAERLQQQREREKRHRLLVNVDEYQTRVKAILTRLEQMEPTVKAVEKWLPENTLPAEIQSLSALVHKFQSSLDSIANDHDLSRLEQKLSSIPGQLAELNSALAGAVDHEGITKAELQGSLSESIAELFQRESPQTATLSKVQAALSEKKEKVRQKLTSARELAYLPLPYQGSLSAALEKLEDIPSIEFLDNFISLEVTPLVRKCTDFSALWVKSGKEYQELYVRYEALIEEVGGGQAETIPFDQAAVAKLQSAIDDLEAKAQEAAEQAYISQALSEVMKEMGYGLWGQRKVRKRSGRQFRNELYHYGADTAINITYSDDGQISMELGKVDREDRLPTKLESQSMETEMHQFCDHFQVIEQRLADKGVKMGSRVMLAPPSADFAQIINITDYDTSRAEESKDRKKHTGKKSQKMAEDQ